MSNKPPTDEAIIKAFKQYEAGFNVFVDLLRERPDLAFCKSHRFRNHPHTGKTIMQSNLWGGHDSAREIVLAAEERKGLKLK